MSEKKPYLYTNINWEDLLDYNGMTWINIDRFKNLQHQLEQKEEIIKEVRELINKIFFKISTNDTFVFLKLKDTEQGRDLLQILDKGVDK